jgi:hypothetical protein
LQPYGPPWPVIRISLPFTFIGTRNSRALGRAARSQSLYRLRSPGYFGARVRNQNSIEEQMKRRLNSRNDSYYLLEKNLFFRLYLRMYGIQIQIYKSILLQVLFVYQFALYLFNDAFQFLRL